MSTLACPRPLKFRIRFEAGELCSTPGGKLICPLCRTTGWGSGWWEHHRHLRHVECPGCHRVFMERGLSRHKRYCEAA